MTVEVRFKFGGCPEEADGTTWLTREFISLNGKGHGFGSYLFSTPQDVAPEGWIAFDPYTGCCYCPKCWEGITSESEPKEETV